MLLVRERPPLWLGYRVVTPGGAVYRWAGDERTPSNVPNGESFSDVMPGGFDTLDLTLPRQQQIDFGDAQLYATITAEGIGGDVAYEGRIAGVPDVAGDQMSITPQAEGWKEHLADDATAKEIFVDIDLSAWQSASTTRQLTLNVGGWGPYNDGSVSPDDSTGQPALEVGVDDQWSAKTESESWYDGQGLTLGLIYYAAKTNNIASVSAGNWGLGISLSDDDLATNTDSATPTGAGPFASSVTVSGAINKYFAFVQLLNSAAGGAVDSHFGVFFTCLGVYGNHGLPGYGSTGATTTSGFLASDVIAYAIGKWAPRITVGDSSQFIATTFVIPHLAFKDPTTAADMMAAVNKFHVREWAVWEGPTMYYHPRGTGPRMKRWQARVGPSKLQETGLSSSRIATGVIVSYQDVTGVTRTVGPPGSTANATDSSLVITDTANPAVAAGIYKPAMVDMGGTSTPEAAIKVGQEFLGELTQLDTSGQASFTGHVEDESGNPWPYWKVRSGDQVRFTDARDTSYRTIIGTHKDVGSRSVSLDLDAPPQALDALLERMQLSLVGLGV